MSAGHQIKGISWPTPNDFPNPLWRTGNGRRAAACRGLDSTLFYHPYNERNEARENRIAQAKAICRQCPVRTACADHALRVREPYGIWGGLSEDERARILGVESLRYPRPSR